MAIRLTEKEASQLLSTLCIKLGFCLSPKMNSRLAKNPPPSADKFANAAYSIEGLDPSLRSDLYKQALSYVEAAFQRHLDQLSYSV
ncbi:MAG: hypothetical protein EOO56_06095 [Hymenobacter sp.]|nr:MAG: hypothetical protein EOO56_06095 [Hymenobacter sp.]